MLAKIYLIGIAVKNKGKSARATRILGQRGRSACRLGPATKKVANPLMFSFSPRLLFSFGRFHVDHFADVVVSLLDMFRVV